MQGYDHGPSDSFRRLFGQREPRKASPLRVHHSCGICEEAIYEGEGFTVRGDLIAHKRCLERVTAKTPTT